jgi:hypothetical protein
MHDRLVAVHSFPETYIFKVIGENTQDFIARVVQAATNWQRPIVSCTDSPVRLEHLDFPVSVMKPEFLNYRLNRSSTVLGFMTT